MEWLVLKRDRRCRFSTIMHVLQWDRRSHNTSQIAKMRS